MAFKDRLHSFKDIPWGEVDLHIKTSDDWAYCKINIGSKEECWSLKKRHPNGDLDIYPLHPALAFIFDDQYRFGIKETKQHIRRALGV